MVGARRDAPGAVTRQKMDLTGWAGKAGFYLVHPKYPVLFWGKPSTNFHEYTNFMFLKSGRAPCLVGACRDTPGL